MMLRSIILLPFVAAICANDHSTTGTRYASETEASFPIDMVISSKTMFNRNNSVDTGINPSFTIDDPQEQLTAANEQARALQGSFGCSVGNFIRGFHYDDNGIQNGANSIPPDPSGAAGAERLVAVVNRMIEVRTKLGVLTFRDGLKDFFAVLGISPSQGNVFDPKVVYDEHAQRFIVIGLQRNATNFSRILLAVSKNERPDSVSDWNMFSMNSAETINGLDSWADYPGFEVDEEAVYITASMFTFSTRSFQGVRLWIVDKGVSGGFYGGGPTTSFGPYNPYLSGGTPDTTMPAQVHGQSGAGSTIGTFLVSSPLFSDGTVNIQIFTIRNPLGNVTFSFSQLSLGKISQDNFVIPDAPQLGSTILIETNDARTLDSVWRNNKLWMTFMINPRTPDIDANQATAHWVRIDTTNGIFTLEAHSNLGGEIFSNQTSTYFAAVALNAQGQVAFGYAASSPTMYAGAYGTIFLGMQEYNFVVQNGLDYYTRNFGGSRNRWGDYTGISVDPTDNSFWIFNQFADIRGSPDTYGEDGRWATAWARVSCTEVRIARSLQKLNSFNVLSSYYFHSCVDKCSYESTY